MPANNKPVPAPPWWVWALAQLGVAEHPGPGSDERILAYRKAAKLGGIQGDDSVVPWCAIFIGAALESTGFRSTRSAAARSYATWGQALKRPIGGCVVPLWRGSPGGALGHVGLLRAVSRDKQYVCLLGGNQNDKVSMGWFPAGRVLGYRWPTGLVVPTVSVPVLDRNRPAKVTEV